MFVFLIAGCASHPAPIIDKRGVNMETYQRDLAECQEYASQVGIASGAAKGAAVGAVVGAAAGAIGGNVDEGAGYGATAGAVRSGLKNQNTKESIAKRCLQGRGYKVLN
ncbi:MAG: glycine zipper family protein [Gammaproteobacteria bacterium]|nr:glycine zipper family protein [Gammaproteobacteria bacterium]